jgi:cysteine desulfurase/selenocysteine lyase
MIIEILLRNNLMAAQQQKLKTVERIRKEFPILTKKINRKPIIYFDNASSGHKPGSVLQRLQDFYVNEYGKPKQDHKLGKDATKMVEETRKKMADFLNAPSEKSIVFTRGCTEGINVVAAGFSKGLLKKGDEVMITALEHHANIIPWQMACAQSGAILKVVPILSTGQVDMKAYEKMLTGRTKIISVSHSSHVFGTILPVKQMIRLAHERDIPVMIDGAQAIPHMPVDVRNLDCDFYVFSAHKMGGPAGVGILYGKKKWLEQLVPMEGGSDMAKKVSFSKTEYSDVPSKFEAGTMPFADIISMGGLVDFLEEFGMQHLFELEQELLSYATKELLAVPGVEIMGSAPEKQAVISFRLENKQAKELEKYLSEEFNIFVKAGDLNAQPLMEILGVKELVRISFSYYNTTQEMDVFIKALKQFLRL